MYVCTYVWAVTPRSAARDYLRGVPFQRTEVLDDEGHAASRRGGALRENGNHGLLLIFLPLEFYGFSTTTAAAAAARPGGVVAATTGSVSSPRAMAAAAAAAHTSEGGLAIEEKAPHVRRLAPAHLPTNVYEQWSSSQSRQLFSSYLQREARKQQRQQQQHIPETARGESEPDESHSASWGVRSLTGGAADVGVAG